MKISNFRVGIGYDSHKLVKGRDLFLGGVKLCFPLGLKGHSDGDVVLHSICDALLGACGLPDIGEIFPDTEKKYKDISSKLIAEYVLNLVKKRKFKIINIDVTIICDKPKISLVKEKILDSLKKIFKTKNVNIKGKTTEKENEKYIKTYSTVLLYKR